MSNYPLPAVSLIPTPGRARAIVDLAREVERRGFSGIYTPSIGDAIGFCVTLAGATEHIRFGTSIVNIYTRHAADYARSAAFVNELCGGRFDFGVGVSHDPVNDSLGLRTGKPLADMRAFVDQLRGAPGVRELPPVVLATLRDPMIRLAGEVGDGIVFANAARSYTPHSISVLPEAKRSDEDFFIGNMIPTCISDDRDAAAARNRKTMLFYMGLPNYRNYWKAAGYVEEMEAVEAAVAAGDRERLPELMTERWLSDCTLYGSASEVREGVERWMDAGVRTPILVPSSAAGNQMKALEELFETFA